MNCTPGTWSACWFSWSPARRSSPASRPPCSTSTVTAKQGLRGARRSSWLLLHDDRLRGTLLFGRTLVNVSAAALASWAALRHWGVIGLAVAIPGMTLLLLLFGALLPRRYGALRSERVALPLSLPLLILQRLCWPLLWLLTLLSNALLRLLGVAAAEQDDSGRSRDEEALHPADNPQASEVNRHDMLLGLLDLEKVTVNDLMIPRNEIEGIDLDDELEVIVEQLRTTSHTRLPVYRDDVNQIEGVVHMRQIARLLTQGRLTKENLRQACMEPYFVPESTPLSTQLVNFQKEKRRIGVVVDEYGEVIGIVTLEDILEEIVGDFNDLDSLDNPDIQAQEDGSFVIDGSANLRELNKSLGWQLPCDGPKTLNGLVTEALEQIPDCAVCLRIGPYCLEIQQSAENRVKSVRAWHPRALTPLVESDASV